MLSGFGPELGQIDQNAGLFHIRANMYWNLMCKHPVFNFVPLESNLSHFVSKPDSPVLATDVSLVSLLVKMLEPSVTDPRGASHLANVWLVYLLLSTLFTLSLLSSPVLGNTLLEVTQLATYTLLKRAITLLNILLRNSLFYSNITQEYRKILANDFTNQMYILL